MAARRTPKEQPGRRPGTPQQHGGEQKRTSRRGARESPPGAGGSERGRGGRGPTERSERGEP